MKTLTLALVGAGSRGMDAYGAEALREGSGIRFVAVAEPDKARREEFAGKHRIGSDMVFADWTDMLAIPKVADGIVIASPDKAHFAQAMAALERGYHILLEKPISPDASECVALGDKAASSGKVLMICHVLRYAPFFHGLKAIVDSGTIGRLLSIQHNENIGYWHFAHSFVRGNWRREDLSSPLMLQKSCHDMDILAWIAGKDCVRVSSFGTLSWFREENAPPGSVANCLDGCAAEATCPYSAMRIYGKSPEDWPANVVAREGTVAALEAALKEGPYGRCVYRCDNDVVDHQAAILEFEGGLNATFNLSAFTPDISRTIKVMGSLGEIRGDMEKNVLEIRRFGDPATETVVPEGAEGGHGGGDRELMADFAAAMRGAGEQRSSAAASVRSHLMVFAAEESRKTGKAVSVGETERKARAIE